MKRLVIITISLGLSLGAIHSAALAQETKEDLTATNGDAAALGNGNASSAPGTVTRAGVSSPSLLGPDGTYRVTESSPPIVTVPSGTVVEIAPAPEPAPIAAAPVEAISPEPTALDTDGDSVADDDEVALYGTDPSVWDTDEDGLSDGEELFASGTDPLLWDTTVMGSRTEASTRWSNPSHSSQKTPLRWATKAPPRVPRPQAPIAMPTAWPTLTRPPSARMRTTRIVTGMGTTTATK
jgi:hypothetical protein